MSAAKTDPHVSVHVESYTVNYVLRWSQLTNTLHIYSQCVQCVPLRQFPLTIMHRPHAKPEELLTTAPHGVKTTPRSQASTSQYHHNHAWPQHSSARWCLIFFVPLIVSTVTDSECKTSTSAPRKYPSDLQQHIGRLRKWVVRCCWTSDFCSCNVGLVGMRSLHCRSRTCSHMLHQVAIVFPSSVKTGRSPSSSTPTIVAFVPPGWLHGMTIRHARNCKHQIQSIILRFTLRNTSWQVSKLHWSSAALRSSILRGSYKSGEDMWQCTG